MALVYRAVWDATLSDAPSAGLGEFKAWVTGKYPEMQLPDEGSVALDGGCVDARTIRVASAGVDAIRATLHEERQTERWTTTVTILAEQSAASFWVDLELVSEDAFQLPDPEPPRLVTRLLELGGDPHRGPVTLRSTPRTWDGDHVSELVRLVRNPTRDIPVVVFTPDPFAGLAEAEKRAKSTARTLAGIATVEVLGPVAVDDFISGMGRPLGVWGGAARIYLPGAGQDDSTYRHFFLTASAIAGDPRDAGRLIAGRLATSTAARRAPAAYETVRAELQGTTLRQTLDKTETQYLQALDEVQRLRQQVEFEENLRIQAVDDLEEANGELEAKISQIRRLMNAIRTAELDDTAWTTEEPTMDPPRSCREAAIRAQQNLVGVVIPDAALSTVDELDSAVESQAWGHTSWRAFRALSAYAEAADSSSGLWDWCLTSSSPDVWPATSKKLAMVESDTVMASSELRGKRLFAVDRAVDATGRVLMVMHMKVAEGGGPLAPRIYFHDDTKGMTGKIHVGFFGPHRYVPNGSTN